MLYQRLRCFLEVANCLSFTTAAKNLYISQQAVSKQIDALEEELGFPLFYRTTRQVVLTPAGSILRDDFSHINRQLSSSIRRARDIALSGKDLLRVGFLSALSRKDIILPITDYLYHICPNTRIDIRLMDFVALRNQLIDSELDFCVTTSNDWNLWPGVQTVVLEQKQFQAVYSDRCPLSQQESLALEDLGSYTQLILPNDTLMEGVEQWGKKIPYNQVLLCPDISTLLVHLELGEGFSLLTKVFDGHESPHLRFWDIPFPEAHAEVVCICNEKAAVTIKDLMHSIQKAHLLRL